MDSRTMCNLCNPYNEPEELVALKPSEAEGVLCDCPSEADETSLCGEPARYCRIDPHVDAHLCEEHMLKRKAVLESGFMELEELIDLTIGAALKPIEGLDSCDEEVGEGGECVKPARYALVVRNKNYLCETHKLCE